MCNLTSRPTENVKLTSHVRRIKVRPIKCKISIKNNSTNNSSIILHLANQFNLNQKPNLRNVREIVPNLETKLCGRA